MNDTTAPWAQQQQQPEEGGFDILGFALRRSWMVFFAIALGVGLGYFYYLKQPVVFRSAAQVLVIKQSANLPVTGDDPLNQGVKRDTLVNDIMIIKSERTLKSAIDTGNLQKLRSFQGKQHLPEVIKGGLRVDRIQEDADVLEIAYSGSDADDCQKIVEAVVNSYRDNLVSAYEGRSGEAIDMFAEAKDKLFAEMRAKETELEEFRQNSNLLIEGDQAISPHEKHVVEIVTKQSQLKLAKSDQEGRLKTIDEAIKKGGSREAILFMVNSLAKEDETATNQAAASTLNIIKELMPLVMEEMQLTENLGEEHPKVLSIRKQIEKTRQLYQEFAAGQVGTGNSKPRDFVTIYRDSLKHQLDATNLTIDNLEKELLEEQEKARAQAGLAQKHVNLINEIGRIRELYQTTLRKLDEVALGTKHGQYSCDIMTPAKRGEQTEPNRFKLMMLGGLLGGIVGLLLALLVESSDASFRSPNEIATVLGLQVLGSCPVIRGASSGTRSKESRLDPSIVAHNARSVVAEAIRAVRTSVLFQCRDGEHRIIQFTSPEQGDGKSTLCANLAVSIAQSGKTVVLIDCDFRRPRVHQLFNIKSKVGMSSVIAGQVEINDAIHKTEIDNLFVLPCGPLPGNPAELLASERFVELLEILREQYDLVMVDTPPMLAVTDPAIVARNVDGVVLCIRLNKRSRTVAIRSAQMLSQMDANVMGIVVNGVDPGRHSNYYYTYGYGNYYGSGKGHDSMKSAAICFQQEPRRRPREFARHSPCPNVGPHQTPLIGVSRSSRVEDVLCASQIGVWLKQRTSPGGRGSYRAAGGTSSGGRGSYRAAGGYFVGRARFLPSRWGYTLPMSTGCTESEADCYFGHEYH